MTTCVNIANSTESMSALKRVTWVGMLVNLGLSGIKFVLGILGCSYALVADAVHSLTDITTDIAVLLGARYWSAPPDEKHPYGHGRIETMVTIIIGLLLGSVAVGIGYKSLLNVQGNASVAPSWWAFAGAALSIVVKEILYQWTYRTGRRIRSSAVKANAWHHRSDALSSIPVAVTIVIAMIYPTWSFVDRIGALVVGVFILYSAWKIIQPALLELVDSDVFDKTRKTITDTAMAMDRVKDVHAIRCRRSGSGILVDMHLLLPPDMSVCEGHTIATDLKHTLINNNDDIIDVVVHIEPYEGKQVA